jgi:hypothetical protein
MFVVVLIGTISTASHTYAAKMTREEMERQFQYGWSNSATVIVYGTVASVDYVDDPRMRAPHAEIAVRVDSVQRGRPSQSIIRVRVEDELQTMYWDGKERRVGETGMWFLHRFRDSDGRTPRGYLVRYVPRTEMDANPDYGSELMRFVIQGTIDQSVRQDVLGLLSGASDNKTSVAIDLTLNYNEQGILTGYEVTERSNNPLFDDHAIDTLLNLHRRIRFPGPLREANVKIIRSSQ